METSSENTSHSTSPCIFQVIFSCLFYVNLHLSICFISFHFLKIFSSAYKMEKPKVLVEKSNNIKAIPTWAQLEDSKPISNFHSIKNRAWKSPEHFSPLEPFLFQHLPRGQKKKLCTLPETPSSQSSICPSSKTTTCPLRFFLLPLQTRFLTKKFHLLTSYLH